MRECNINGTHQIVQLLAARPPEPDDAWRTQFYNTVYDASFACGDPQVLTGPDGFPYFTLFTPEPNQPFESFCICNLLEPATEQGFGIVINPTAEGADWVFTYGDLVTHRLFGAFEVDAPPSSLPPVETTESSETVLIGSPSESYLPGYVRAVLRGFLTQGVGISEPGVLLMHRPAQQPPQQLLFSIFPEDFNSEADFFGVLRAISWFLPRHYLVAAVPRDSGLTDSFQPL
jgi:hypothetical protein